MLRDAKACKEEVEEFERLFPKGRARLTRANLVKARSLNLGWAVDAQVLPVDGVEYRRKCAAIWDEYERKCALLIADMLGLK
jgi:hypothetical protein